MAASMTPNMRHSSNYCVGHSCLIPSGRSAWTSMYHTAGRWIGEQEREEKKGSRWLTGGGQAKPVSEPCFGCTFDPKHFSHRSSNRPSIPAVHDLDIASWSAWSSSFMLPRGRPYILHDLILRIRTAFLGWICGTQIDLMTAGVSSHSSTIAGEELPLCPEM